MTPPSARSPSSPSPRRTSADEQARAYNRLVAEGKVTPVLGEVVPFDAIPDADQRMGDGIDVFGNRVALAGASAPGLGTTSGQRGW